MVAAIVCSLALAWGVGEVAGYRRSLECHPFAAKWFYGVFAAAVVGSAAVVGFASDLVWLNIAILRAAARATRSLDARASFCGVWMFCFWCGQMVQMLSGGCPFAQDELVGNLPTEMLLAALTDCGAPLPKLGPLDELMGASAELFSIGSTR